MSQLHLVINKYLVTIAIEKAPGITQKGLIDLFKADELTIKLIVEYLVSEKIVTDDRLGINLTQFGVYTLYMQRSKDTNEVLNDYLVETLIRADNAEMNAKSIENDIAEYREQALRYKTAVATIKAYIQKADSVWENEDNE